MLKHLYIKNFIFIDTLELTFDHGVIMITGETGAGKSIILGAIDAALGQQRNLSEKIKLGEKEAEIILTFDISTNQKAQHFLTENALEDDETICIIRRIIYADGKTRNFINGRPSNVTTLRNLGELLLTLHTQHENQLLLSTQEQTELLDAYADNGHLLKNIEKSVSSWKKIDNEIKKITTHAGEKNQRLDYLSYQAKELQAAKLDAEEILALPVKHKALTSAQETLQYYDNILSAFSPNDSLGVIDMLQRLRQPIFAAEKISQSKELSEILENAIVQLEELRNTTSYQANKVDTDPEKLQQLEARLSELHQLARKHQVKAEELPALLEKIECEIDDLSEAEKKIKTLQKEKINIEAEYQKFAEELTKKREKAAIILSKKVTEVIHELGMPAAEFSIALNERTASSEDDVATYLTPHIAGAEHAEFLLKANAGQQKTAIKKAASGGELARVSLALQTTLAAYIQIPTLILDEIDVGVGGKVAAQIGQQLRELGKTHQVMCITHQAHIAAAGHQHFKVEKMEEKNQTHVKVEPLDQPKRTQEIARMLGGITITENAVQHAKEMLQNYL